MSNLPYITVNNFFTTINVTIFVVGGVVGIIAAVVMKLGNKLVDEYFKERENKRKRKRNLAKDVIAICTEGASVGYNAMPGSQRHIQYVAGQIEGLDKTIADDLRKYLGLWVICAIQQTPGPYEKKNPTKEDIEFCASLQRDAAVLENSILERVRRWE